MDQAKVGLSAFAFKEEVLSLFYLCHDKENHTVSRLLLLSWGCFCILGTLETQSVVGPVGGVAHGNFWVDWRDAAQNPEKQKSPAESPE